MDVGGAIWAFIEIAEGGLPESSHELLCEARRLADRRRASPVGAVLLGDGAGDLAGIPARYGVERVFFGEDAHFSRYRPETFTAVLADLISRHDPAVFLFGATVVGRDLAPRVAARVRAGLIPGCDRLEISEDGDLTATRLSHGKKVQTTARYRNARPQMAIVEPGIAKIRTASPPGGTVSAEIVRIHAGPGDGQAGDRVRVSGFIKADPKTVDIADAEVIVAGGRGASEIEGFRLIEELAEALGASLAGSRVAVDNGWITRERQIGQSGKTVSPRLLISCGISGANAHVMGIRDAGVIVAINSDRNAPILSLADLAVVADLREILPALSDRIRRNGA